MRLGIKLSLLATILCLSVGCASTHDVRFVYQDGDYGVVGLPENTDCWPTHYRRQAEKLMIVHFPEGHEIIRAEEVVEGERTVKLEDSKTAEVAPQVPSALLNIAKLGRTASSSQSDTVKLKECRIIYRRVGDPEKREGYASASSLTPGQYVDPNAAGREKAGSGDRHPDEPEKPAKVQVED